jgi:O-antigen chain-terminating methyltransferase
MTSSFYSAFEAHFRGSRQEIKLRLHAYAPFWEPFLNLGEPCLAIDLGCGRGEWLELMQEVGIDATGVDLDEGMLAIAREHGLKVSTQDAIQALSSLPAESQSIVSGFHIAEHLAFEVLQKLVQESFRVLRPGGLLILETPNPENIAVATNYFYIDPTHIRPLSPDLMAFLPKYYGFFRSKIVRLQEDPSLIKQPTLTIAQIVHGVSPDYAVIAQKGGPPELLGIWDGAFDRSYGVTLGALSDRFYRLQLEKEQALQAQADRYTAIVNSSSWKITAPLRGLKTLISGLQKNGKDIASISSSAVPKENLNLPFIRRSVSKLTRRFPALHLPLAAIARRLGALPPAPKLIEQRPWDQLGSMSQLTLSERQVYDQFERVLQQKRRIKK